MDLLLFHREDVSRLYNCSYSVDAVPLENRKHPVVGCILIALTIFYEASYIPCLIVFARHKKNSSCYKIMLFLGICDVINLVFVGFFMGLVTINGWVYCSSPVLMHFVGTIAPGFWYLESTAALVLAVNRGLDICAPAYAERFFKGSRTWLLLCGPAAYAIFMMFAAKTCPFNSIWATCSFNPHLGYIDDVDGKYLVPIQTVHNFGVAILNLVFYVIICIAIGCKTKSTVPKTADSLAGPAQVTIPRKSLFAQVLIISIINVICASIYDLMIEQFIEISFAVSLTSTFAWQAIHGAPGVVYCLMNKSVRQQCRRMFAFGKNQVGESHSHYNSRRPGLDSTM